MKKTMVTLVLVFVAGATTVFAMGKPNNEEAPKGVDPTGVYTLVEIDGKKIPVTIVHGKEMKVHSGTFTISNDGTCVSKIVFGPLSGEKAEREVKATYTQKGSTLKMKWIGAGWTTGTVDGDTFKMNNEGMIFSYKKQP